MANQQQAPHGSRAISPNNVWGADKSWIILGVLFVVRFALGLQFQTAGSVTPFLLGEFGASYTGVGALVGLFMPPGIILALPVGYAGQRFGAKSVVIVGLFALAAGGFLSAYVTDYTTIAAGRVSDLLCICDPVHAF
jgi:predicted MFS family arabinose efflux permease